MRDLLLTLFMFVSFQCSMRYSLMVLCGSFLTQNILEIDLVKAYRKLWQLQAWYFLHNQTALRHQG